MNGCRIKGTCQFNDWTIHTISNAVYAFNAFVGTDANAKLELKNWSTTGNGFTTMSNAMRNAQYAYLDVSGWDANMTENVITWAYMGYAARGIKEIKGLNNWKFNSSTSFVYFMYDMRSLLFGPAGSDTNFASDAFDNPSGSNVSFYGSFYLNSYNGDGGNYTNAHPPNISSWDMSAGGSFSYAFQNVQFNASVDISNWDMSNATDCTGMFYAAYSISRPTTVTTQFNNLSSSCTSFVNCWRGPRS